MTGNITLALNTAQSGILASQAALDAVAHNITNANTPGYSRKNVNLEQRVVAGTGAGVQLSSITRAIDEGLLKSLRIEQGSLNELDVMRTTYDRLQDLFGQPADNTSISHVITSFAQALESLALSPQRSVEQSDTVRWGNEIGIKLQDMSNTIQELRLQADRSISDIAARSGILCETIENLNNQIIRNDTIGHDVTDLMDKRDMAIDELATYMDIRYYKRDQGDIVVFTSGGSVLVDSAANTISHGAATAVTPLTTYAEGHFGGLYIGAAVAANDATTDLQSGKLKGLIDLRDHILTDLQSQIDELAAELRDAVNLAHNQGTPFPGMSSAEGSRSFVDSSTQTITLANGTDSILVLTDGSGDQQTIVTLDTLMQDAAYGSGAQAAGGPWTLDEVALKIEDWLQANGCATAAVAFDTTTGKLALDLNSNTRYLSFRDQDSATYGDTATDAVIRFDADADGLYDETYSGFSNFLGINDFFIDGLSPTHFDSNVLSSTWSFTPTADVTLTFDYIGGAAETVTLTNGTNYTLQDIADLINDNTNGISFAKASLVPDGSGYRLRFTQNDSVSMSVSDDMAAGSANSVLEVLGLSAANVRAAQFLQVRPDIVDTPGLISRGILQWDSNRGATGEYYLSAGDNTTAQAMAAAMHGNNQFDTAGGLASINTEFADYAAGILSNNATMASDNKLATETQESLTNSLKLKSDNYRGVNLDEEMSNLILYQQAFAASARVITVVKEMFDALDRAVGA